VLLSSWLAMPSPVALNALPRIVTGVTCAVRRRRKDGGKAETIRTRWYRSIARSGGTPLHATRRHAENCAAAAETLSARWRGGGLARAFAALGGGGAAALPLRRRK